MIQDSCSLSLSCRSSILCSLCVSEFGLTLTLQFNMTDAQTAKNRILNCMNRVQTEFESFQSVYSQISPFTCWSRDGYVGRVLAGGSKGEVVFEMPHGNNKRTGQLPSQPQQAHGRGKPLATLPQTVVERDSLICRAEK